jgi:hypothetical protein
MTSSGKLPPELLNLLNTVANSGPEIGHVMLESQRLNIKVNYDPPPSFNEGYRSVVFTIYGETEISTESGTKMFLPPIENWNGTVPNEIFGMEGEKVKCIKIDESDLIIITDNVSLKTKHESGLYSETIHISFPPERDHFIL